MDFKWTKDQERIIKFSGGNLLVAAGAGSGKTAVLTAHIIKKITDPLYPVDLDQLLVVTFTNAAAAQMKERLRQSLEEMLLDEPDNTNITRQIGLIPSANISTIHSFCLKMIREQFFRLDIDPNFRLGDMGELALMKADILEEIFEEQYAAQVESFLNFRDMYAKGMDDEKVTELILNLYEYSRSYPFPGKWLDNCLSDNLEWADDLKQMILKRLLELYEMALGAEKMALREGFPSKYVLLFKKDATVLSHAAQIEELSALSRAVSEISFDRKPTLNKDEKAEALGLEDLIKEAFDIRDQIKDGIKALKELSRGCSKRQLMWEADEMAPMRHEMVRLVRLFSERFDERKRALSICDFSDLEHMALALLYNDDAPSDVADTYAAGFREVLVDEYQDCNLVQEAILFAISKERFGEENRFMVGDVKQSIYGFRQARPGLFLEKYNSYSSSDEEKLCKIELSENFRSRSSVLLAINMIFSRIMIKELGGIDYDKNAALKPMASMPQRSKDIADLEVMLLGLGDDAKGDDSAKEDDLMSDTTGYNNKEHEARMLGAKILQLVNPADPFMVYDGKLGKMRPVKFNDIAILTRSLSATQESFVRVLKEMGIPVYVENETGYFSSVEVVDVLNYLRLLDNPLQDIPLAGVMRSAFGGFSAQELADIRLGGVGKGYSNSFYSCCMAERENSKKLDGFFVQLEKYRRLSRFLPIHELLLRIFEETGYRYYVMALPQGKKRIKNLDILVAKARAYEETSYRGLFNFIRYIDRMRKYDVEEDIPAGSDEDVDAVRMMTIHKSKGLEFPVVFLANMNAGFNRMDLNASVLLDEKYGIGADILNPRIRYRAKSIKKAVMREKKRSALLEEEMRVLYVAMTRAKELLIITGAIKDMDAQLKKWIADGKGFSGTLSSRVLSSAKSFLDWVMPALFSWDENNEKDCTADILEGNHLLLSSSDFSLAVRKIFKDQISIKPLVYEEIKEDEGDISEKLFKILSWSYPHERLTKLHAAMSVTELKRAAYDEEEALSVMADTDRSRISGKKSGAKRGTAYHRVLQLFNFSEYPLEADDKERDEYVSDQLHFMKEQGSISEEEIWLVSGEDIKKFFRSPLAERMCTAARLGKYHAEQPFLLGVSAGGLISDDGTVSEGEDDERILVRGIIDSFFKESDGLVLVDYKTDYVPGEGGEEKLRARYKDQLFYYAKALEQAIKLPVKEAYIYSFALEREIRVLI